MRVINHNWSATKQHLHPQSVTEISRHTVLSGDRNRQCETSSGSRQGRLKMHDQKMEEIKKDERTENAGLKMKDQMSGVENAGPENAGPKHQDRKMEDQQPEADYEI